MPTNRTRIKHKKREKYDISEDCRVAFLLTGEMIKKCPEGVNKFLHAMFPTDPAAQKKLWAEIEADVLPDFLKKHPGVTPWILKKLEKQEI